MSVIEKFLNNKCTVKNQERSIAIKRLVRVIVDRYGYQNFSRKLKERQLRTSDSYLGMVEVKTPVYKLLSNMY